MTFVRYLVPIDFSDVEKYWYSVRYDEALDDLGLAMDGIPRRDPLATVGWDLNLQSMNASLLALRQRCCHPFTGAANKSRLGQSNSLSKVSQTLEEVLEAMRMNVATTLQSDVRELWASRVTSGQLMCWEMEECENFENALNIFAEAIEALTSIAEGLLLALQTAVTELRDER